MHLIVRRYNQEDIPRMIELVEQFINEERTDGYVNHFQGIPFNAQVVTSLLELGLHRRNRFFTNIVTDREGNILGGLTAEIMPFVFSDKLVAKDYLLYFVPEFTNVKALLVLIDTYVEWAEWNGAVEVQLATSTGFKQEKFGTLMKRLNFSQFEIGYARRL